MNNKNSSSKGREVERGREGKEETQRGGELGSEGGKQRANVMDHFAANCASGTKILKAYSAMCVP